MGREALNVTLPASPDRTPLKRPEHYGKLLDPDRALPFVEIEEKYRVSETGITHFAVSGKKRKPIGEFELFIKGFPDDAERTAFINGIKIIPDLRRKQLKYGRAIYAGIVQMLAEKNIRLFVGTKLSRGSKYNWDEMTRAGAARMTDPGVTDETVENKGYSTAKYEIV
jgi:hypothetical protein